MSDWASIRLKKKVEKEHTEGVNFVYEDDANDDDDDDDEIQVNNPEEPKPVEEEKRIEVIPEERMQQIERKAAFKVALKKSVAFGVGGGCMLGGMLGLYDTFQKAPGAKYTMSGVLKRMTVSLPTSLLCMGGFFGIYQVTKVSMQYFRNNKDYYNNVTGCAVGLLPFMKMPFMRKYILYPFVLLILDVYGDWREMHPKYYVSCNKQTKTLFLYLLVIRVLYYTLESTDDVSHKPLQLNHPQSAALWKIQKSESTFNNHKSTNLKSRIK